MRRVITLLVVALVGAFLYGLTGVSSGVKVNAQSVSASTMRNELAAISHHDTLQCYITALDPVNYAPATGGYSIAAAGAASWTNLRIEGLAISQYVTEHLHYVPASGDLAKAKISLEGEMTEQAKANNLTCPGTPAEALQEMPAEMRQAEIYDQDTSTYLVEKLHAAIPLTLSSLKTFYAAHQADYDKLCVSVALVEPSEVTTFEQAESSGLSVAALAKKYSLDSSAATGGAYGCYAPSSEYYSSVRSDVGTTATGHFTSTPQYTEDNGSEYALFVAPTERTVTPFAKAESAVLSDVQSINANSANTEKNTLLYEAAVHVDPAFGRWALSSSGPGVTTLAVPARSDAVGPGAVTASGTTTYK